VPGGIWPVEEVRAAVVSVDVDRLALDILVAVDDVPAVVVTGVGRRPSKPGQAVLLWIEQHCSGSNSVWNRSKMKTPLPVITSVCPTRRPRRSM